MRRRIVTLGCVLLWSGLPGSASLASTDVAHEDRPSRRPQTEAAFALAGGHVTTPHHGASPAAAYADRLETGGRRDDRAIAPDAVVADLLSEIGQRNPIALSDVLFARLADPERVADYDAEPVGDSPERWFLTTADMDGDGLEDVIGAEIVFDWEAWTYESVELLALRGTDGTELWRFPVFEGAGEPSGLVLEIVPDLDGDGIADVLTIEIAGFPWLTYTCEAVGFWVAYAAACLEGTEADTTWRHAFRSGEDAETLWARTIDGIVDLDVLGVGTSPGFVMDYRLEIAPSAVLPFVVEDRNGDGRRDVLIDVVDSVVEGRFAETGGGFAETFGTDERTEASFVVGSDGSTIETVAQPEVGAVLLPVGDAVGSHAVDFAWVGGTQMTEIAVCALAVGCHEARAAPLRIDMLDGESLAVAWTFEHSNGSRAWPAGADVNGDGKADLFVERDGELALIRGDSGAEAWSFAVPASYGVALLGDFELDGGAELLFIWGDWSYTVHSARIDGSTGEERFSTAYASEGWVWIEFAGDMDGDGILDLAFDEYFGGGSSFSGRFLVESGRSGEALFDEPVAADAWYFTVDDQNGDGKDDLASGSVAGDPLAQTLSVHDGTGAPRWSREVPAYSYVFGSFGDVDGVPGSDLVLEVWLAESSQLRTRFESLSGTTGATRWVVGDPDPEPGDDGPRPANDAIADALVLSVPGSIETSTVHATTEASEPLPCDMGATVWFKLEIEEDAVLEASTDGSEFDTVLAVYQDTVSENALIDCNDDSEFRYTSLVEFDVAAGETILIQAGGWFGDAGTLRLSVAPGTDAGRPTNDRIADAAEVVRPHAGTYSTVGARVERDEPRPCGAIGATVWFTFLPTADGTAVIDTTGSDFDTVLAAYRGSVAPDTVNGCNDDTNVSTRASLRIPVEAGVRVFVQAGGFAGEDGQLVLSIV